MKVGITFRWIMLFLFLLTSNGWSAKKGDFKPPSLDGYWHYGDVPYDADHDGSKESVLSFYKNSAGDKIVKTTTNGIIWHWGEKSHNFPIDKDDINNNYGIIDSDCDNVFDTKYNFNTNFNLPSCLKNNNSNE